MTRRAATEPKLSLILIILVFKRERGLAVIINKLRGFFPDSFSVVVFLGLLLRGSRQVYKKASQS